MWSHLQRVEPLQRVLCCAASRCPGRTIATGPSFAMGRTFGTGPTLTTGSDTQMILSQIPATKYPHLHELTAKHVLSDEYAYSDEFIYGLELILDQLSVRKGLQ